MPNRPLGWLQRMAYKLGMTKREFARRVWNGRKDVLGLIEYKKDLAVLIPPALQRNLTH